MMRVFLLLSSLHLACSFVPAARRENAVLTKPLFSSVIPQFRDQAGPFRRDGAGPQDVRITPPIDQERGVTRGVTDFRTQLLVDLSEDFGRLDKARPPDQSKDPSSPKTIISAGSSYTRLWTNKTWKHHSAPPLTRYIRHVLKWPLSTTAKVILPSVIAAAAWSYWLYMKSYELGWFGVVAKGAFATTAARTAAATKASAATSIISFLSAPLALLLSIRANESMKRLLEARLLWGRLILHVRALSSIVKVYMFPGFPQASVFIARHLAVLGWAQKAGVRDEKDEYNQEVLRLMLGNGIDYRWLAAQPKCSQAIISRIRQMTAAVIANYPDPVLGSSLHLTIERKLEELELCVGGNERLFSSPIPPTYSRHLSRILFMWIALMPCSLISMGLSKWGVVGATTIAAYVLIGLDEVGVEIENAFQLLPLQQLASRVHQGVRNQFVPEKGQPPEITVL